MSDGKPLGLTEAEENDFRVLLSKIREHDIAFLNDLLLASLRRVQVENSVRAYHYFDDDDILTDLVLVAKGISASTRLNDDFKKAFGGGH